MHVYTNNQIIYTYIYIYIYVYMYLFLRSRSLFPGDAADVVLNNPEGIASFSMGDLIIMSITPQKKNNSTWSCS